MGNNDSNAKGGHDLGKNLGQGLGNITDEQRRALAGTGDDAPTQDQRRAPRSSHQNAGSDAESGRSGD